MQLVVAIFLFVTVYGAHCHQITQNLSPQQFDIWGDLGQSKIVLGSAKTKYAIPFVKRTIEFKYPKDFGTDEGFGTIRGIKHSNQLNDTDCRPEARLTSGGVNAKSATVEVTSVRSCGLNSLVEFFIEQKPIRSFGIADDYLSKFENQ